MILPDMYIWYAINKKKKFLHIDSYAKCLDKKHFKSFPYKVDYAFNSRGFRDREWPDSLDELKQSIWCIGDSFTVGIGSPVDHMWVRRFENKIGQRCINVSRDGASNNWIARQAIKILSTIKPKILIIHWSYSHRIEQLIKGDYRQLVYRQLHFSYDNLNEITKIKNFLNIMETVKTLSGNTTVINSFIPHWHPSAGLSKWDEVRGSDWPERAPITVQEFRMLSNNLQNEIKLFDPDVEDNFEIYQSRLLFKSALNDFCYIDEFPQLDYARDSHHYDYKTADYFSNLLIDKLSSISSAEAI